MVIPTGMVGVGRTLLFFCRHEARHRSVVGQLRDAVDLVELIDLCFQRLNRRRADQIRPLVPRLPHGTTATPWDAVDAEECVE